VWCVAIDAERLVVVLVDMGVYIERKLPQRVRATIGKKTLVL
jgi:hypothetical protein